MGRNTDAVGNRDTAMANARVSRRREQEALAEGDQEGARIQAGIAGLYEGDADFWSIASQETS